MASLLGVDFPIAIHTRLRACHTCILRFYKAGRSGLGRIATPQRIMGLNKGGLELVAGGAIALELRC